MRTWLVECYGPGIDAASVAEASDRARAAVEVARGHGAFIEYLGALLIASDEAVFHAFAAPSMPEVDAASTKAGLQFARIVESVSIAAPELADALSRLLDSPAPRARRAAG